MRLGLRHLFDLLLRRNVYRPLEVFQRHIEAAAWVFTHASSLAAEGSPVEAEPTVHLVLALAGPIWGQGGAGAITAASARRTERNLYGEEPTSHAE